MPSALEVESTLTDRYQTTIPNAVRCALKLGKRDKIHYSVQSDGVVVLARAAPAEETDDPVVGHFLEFLARDMQLHPEHVEALDPAWLENIRSLVADVEVDLDSPLSPDDE